MGIAGLIVLDLVKQSVYRHGGQHLHRLLNGGQLDPGQAAVPDVIKAEEGQILRDAQADLLRRLHDAKSVGVCSGEDGGEMPLPGKKLLGQLVAVFHRGK